MFGAKLDRGWGRAELKGEKIEREKERKRMVIGCQLNLGVVRHETALGWEKGGPGKSPQMHERMF